MTAPLNILFAGTPDFAVPPLAALIDSPHRIVAVLTQPDRPAGRGRRLTPSPVRRHAEAHGLTVLTPATLKDPTLQSELRALQADLMVVVAYGLILPQAVLEIPRHGCINIHASLLPRWRGAAPIHRALLAGDRETGITLMQMDAGLDTGPMLRVRRLPIDPDDTSGTLHDRLATLGAEVLMETLALIQAGTLQPVAQDDALASYAHKLDKAEADIDWHSDAVALERQVRAFNPWPVAQTLWQGRTLRIWQAQARPAAGTALPGRILHADRNGIDVATGNGILRLLQVQLPGARPIGAGDLHNAHPEIATGRLGTPDPA
jgi:methionyl-tRNA formyltransferase